MRQHGIATLAALLVTVLVYAVARELQRRTGWLLLNPVLVSIIVIIAALRLAGVDYADYALGGDILAMLLGPAIVALGVPLYFELPLLRSRGLAILITLVIGSLVGVLSGALTVAALGAGDPVIRTLTARSVTTPIAIALVEPLGGIPALAAAVSIASGMAGALIGPPLLRRLGVTSATAFGLAMGAAAHGLGTARAAEQGSTQGAASGLALGLMGVATAVVLPLLVVVLGWIGIID